MMHSDLYDAAPADVAALLASADLGRLVTVDEEGVPYVGLYPFLVVDGTIELHLNTSDRQAAHLRARPRCTFEVDQVLATIPSSWLDPEQAAFATAYHRSAQFVCDVEISDDPLVIAAQQGRLMAAHQPDGSYRPVDADDPLYRSMVRMLVAVTLRPTSTLTKFKLAQNRTPEQRRAIVARLRERATGVDLPTADALESTLTP